MLDFEENGCEGGEFLNVRAPGFGRSLDGRHILEAELRELDGEGSPTPPGKLRHSGDRPFCEARESFQARFAKEADLVNEEKSRGGRAVPARQQLSEEGMETGKARAEHPLIP